MGFDLPREWMLHGAMKRHAARLLLPLALVACTGDDLTSDTATAVPAPAAYRSVAALDAAARGPVQVRWDVERDRPAAVIGEFAVTGAPEVAARGFLRSHAALFRIAPEAKDLALMTTRRGLTGTHLRFQQRVDGLPVFDRQVVVTLSLSGDRVRAVQLNHEAVAAPPVPRPIGDAAALARARAQVGAPAEIMVPTVERGVDLDHGAPRQAYRVTVAAARATWEVGVDAATGAVVWTRDRNVNANGTGMVFDTNAVASTGNTALPDNNDATSAALDAARFMVTLPNLDGSGVLRGTYADARPTNAGQRATSATLTFNYDRADNRFEEVMAYYHLDRAQAHIQALGFTDVNHRVQVARVNATTADNSFYTPATKDIRYGSGGVDDAEDD